MDLIGVTAKDPEVYQVLIRTVIVFFIALVFIRISGMRTFGTRSAFDVVVSITLGAVLSRGIMGHYPFQNCMAAGALIVILHRLVGYISARSKRVRKLTEGTPEVLFDNNELKQENLKKYSITQSDIQRALHEQNLSGFSKVSMMILETDGSITVIKNET